MRSLVTMIVLAGLALPAGAADMRSDYTEIDIAKDCATFEVGESDFASLACPGWRGYPVLYYLGDLRESVFYGYPPSGAGHVWESFSAFNSTGPTIEWRIETEGERERPIAAIHRWFVSSDPDNPDRKVEVLVVEKVGQVGERDGCTVGLVMASGNPGANEMARRIADEQAREFACGADERVLVGDGLPAFDRQEN